MELKKEDTITLALFAVFVVGLSLFTYFVFKPSITGFVVYSPDEYIYDNTKINTSGNEIKLMQTITETSNITEHELNSYLTSAVYNGEDKLSQVNSIGNGEVPVKNNKIFNIVFNDILSNGDKINLYMKNSKAGNVYVCDTNVECNGDYGSSSYNGEDITITIVLSGLSNGKNDFSINNNDDIKIDYITATYKNITTEVITASSYPNSAFIETNDLNVNNISKWDSVLIDEALNGQNVNYYYSTDSGANWVLTNRDLSMVSTAAKKIRIKMELTSDGINTPILSNLIINYTTICNENWTCNDWSDCLDEQQSRTCADTNNCGSYGEKPDEARACIANTTPNATQSENNFTRIIYFSEINAELIVITSTNISNVSFNLINSSLTLQNKQKLKSLDIRTSQSIQDFLLSAVIKVYYNETELRNIDENTLSLYYYNETSSIWDKIPSEVNTIGNYILANIIHFSVYGIFGDEQVIAPTSSSSSSGSSGGGSSGGSSSGSIPSESIPVVETKEKIEEKVIENKPIIEENKTTAINAEEPKPKENLLKRFTGLITKTVGENNILKSISGLGVRTINEKATALSIFLISLSIFIIIFVIFYLFRPK